MVLACVGVLAFSFTLPMTKIAVRGIDPFVAAVGRAVVAAALAAIVLRARHAARPNADQLRRLAIVALGVIVGFPLLTAYALHHSASAHGAVVIGLLPLATAGLAVARANERPSPIYWACSVIGLAAVVMFSVHQGGGSFHAADELLLAAVISAAVGYTEGALLARAIGGWQVICWALVLCAPITLTTTVLMAMRPGALHATVGQWTAFGYTAVVSMFLGFFAWYGGMARAGIARAGQVQLAQPALSMLWGWPLLGERLTLAAMVTAGVLFGAVAIGRRAAVRW